MKLLLLAVGHKPPAWAEQVCNDYARRFPPDLRLDLRSVKAESRTERPPAQCKAAEALRLDQALQAWSRGARRVVLDERGERVDTAGLARRLEAWKQGGRDVAWLIGGPDGLDEGFRATADECLRLSDLTLPHALVRVIAAEALYRAWSLGAGHPYHRE
ncbi:MAG: 23S rRNA (pseudouridine(1915)-N(3))-methyltransferase RlmH [Ideonella sp.]|nr:23S rRNA (pseudouridine(1915)-N(3))-methyltransferase RlmH [Ideonella sp.]